MIQRHEIAHDEVRRHAVVSGRVQGVSFRYYTVQRASDAGLTGWVRNRADGSVELEVQGAAEAVAAFLDWVEAGPSYAQVTSVAVTERDLLDGQQGFDVVR